jgi:Domain of unknown function (DUF2382)
MATAPNLVSSSQRLCGAKSRAEISKRRHANSAPCGRGLCFPARGREGERQIAVVTGTREQLVDEELTRVRVEIERVPIGRSIEVMPPVSQDGDTTIIPIVEEIVVVERRLILKEELRIRRVSTKEQHREAVVLREQQAVITRKEASSQSERLPPKPIGSEQPLNLTSNPSISKVTSHE